MLLESKLILIKTLRKSTGHCKNLKTHIYFASLASTAQIGTNQYDIYYSRNFFKNSILYKDFIHHTNFMVIENESELQKYSLRQKKIIM